MFKFQTWNYWEVGIFLNPLKFLQNTRKVSSYSSSPVLSLSLSFSRVARTADSELMSRWIEKKTSFELPFFGQPEIACLPAVT